MAERLLAGPSAKLRAKIAQKQEFRPTRTVEKNMPVGSKSLEKVPMLKDFLAASSGAEADAEAARASAIAAYKGAVHKTGQGFSRFHRDL